MAAIQAVTDFISQYLSMLYNHPTPIPGVSWFHFIFSFLLLSIAVGFLVKYLNIQLASAMRPNRRKSDGHSEKIRKDYTKK
jgi:hypothetical protein